MKKLWQKIDWIAGTVLGSAAFALGFALFLDPNDINTGGVSALPWSCGSCWALAALVC